MESRHPSRAVLLATDIVKADLLTVRRVQERHAVLALKPRLLPDPTGVPLSLGEDSLRANRELLGFDNTKDTLARAEGVVSRSVECRKLSDCGRFDDGNG